MDEDVTSFNLHRQGSLNQDQMYVALIRITSLDRMFLIGNYNETEIKENSSAKQEYQRLRQESKFTTLPFVSVSEMTLNITLLNTRSLKKHYEDIMKDKHLLDSDILCFTKTQLQIDEDTSVIESRFQEHSKIHFNSNKNKYRSIAFCYSNRVSVLDHENYVISIIAVKSRMNILNEHTITIALVYRSPKSPIASFLDQMVYFTDARTTDILQGDFNIDVFDRDAYIRLDEVLSSCRLMVKEPIHLDGGLLDHVYLLKSFPRINVNSIAKNIYFSDHDALKLQILAEENDEIDFERSS